MKNNLILYAFAVLTLGNLFATFSDVLIKVLGHSGGIYQYLLLRQLFLLFLISPFWLRQTHSAKGPGNIKVQGLRAVLGNIGGAGAVVALLYLPLATANVIFYAAPLITMLAAAWLLKEPIKKHRLIAMAIGFVGIAIAMRPEYINFAGLAALTTAFCIAGFNLSVRWLPESTSLVSTIFWTTLIAIPITASIAVFNWTEMNQELLILSAGACVCVLVYQGCCILAFRNADADAGAVAIAEYTGLVFAALLGWGLFNEHLDHYTMVGIGLIILPIIWQSLKEKPQPQDATEYLVDTSPSHPSFLAQSDGEHPILSQEDEPVSIIKARQE